MSAATEIKKVIMLQFFTKIEKLTQLLVKIQRSKVLCDALVKNIGGLKKR